jgi:hypothetical protein
MPTLKAIHICRSHQPTHKPKPAKELAYTTHRQKTMQQKIDITTDEKEHRTANSGLA